jgi:hypothetical protein
MSQGGANKVRVDACYTVETKRFLDIIIQQELKEDLENDWPKRPRSRSEIIEMLTRKGINAWGQERDHKNLKNETDSN